MKTRKSNKPKKNKTISKSFPPTSIKDAAGCLKYPGKAKNLKEMVEAIRKGVERAGFPCL